MGNYEKVADQLRQYDFCEGCSFVRKVLNLAYSIDHPEPVQIPEGTPASTRKLIVDVREGSPPLVLAMEMDKAAKLRRMQAETACRGLITLTYSNVPEPLASTHPDLFRPEEVCGLEGQNAREYGASIRKQFESESEGFDEQT